MAPTGKKKSRKKLQSLKYLWIGEKIVEKQKKIENDICQSVKKFLSQKTEPRQPRKTKLKIIRVKHTTTEANIEDLEPRNSCSGTDDKEEAENVSLKEEDSSDLDLEHRNSCSGTDEKEEAENVSLKEEDSSAEDMHQASCSKDFEEEAENNSLKEDDSIENSKASCSKYIEEEIEEDSSVENSDSSDCSDMEEEAVNVSFKQDHYIDENCKASCSKYIQEEIEEDSSVESSERRKLRKKTKISRKDLRMLGPSREPRASIPSNQLMTQI